MQKLKSNDIIELAGEFGFDPKAVKALIAVECSGHGFDPTTGKIVIQFEPVYFHRYTRRMIHNGVEGQAKEWEAFNEAFAIHPTYAMMSTSWGMGQVMGNNFPNLGFKTVDEMVDFCKESERNQVWCALKYIESRRSLKEAFKALNWPVVAYYYNGEGYKKNNYDYKLKTAYETA